VARPGTPRNCCGRVRNNDRRGRGLRAGSGALTPLSFRTTEAHHQHFPRSSFIQCCLWRIAYVRQRRVDYLAGNLFALATIPGAIAGALVVSLVPRRAFDLLFGLVLLLIAAFLQKEGSGVAQRRHRRGEVTRSITDAHGDTYVFSYNLTTGIVVSLFVGFISSLLGIGGGIIHVPLMVQVFHFPTHIATATSQYVLAITALTGTTVHALGGDINDGYRRIASLGLGVLIGAQFGARLSTVFTGPALVRLLSLALVAVGLRLCISALVA
jgi:uncharacterized protein